MKIEFLGDSITDSGSYRKPKEEFTGYVKYAAESLGDKNEYFNCGVSGDESRNLLARYEADVKAVAPDILVILIGINDLWRGFDCGRYTSPEVYEANYRELLVRVKRDLPKTKIVVLEPFLLPAPDKTYWRPMLAPIIEAARNVAVEYADAFVPLDGILNAARMDTDWRELSGDGVHPAPYGEKFIGKIVADAVKKFL